MNQRDSPRLPLCVTCGTQFAASPNPPPCCPICEDERQYVGPEGQRWTALDELRAGHRNRIEQVEPGLTGIGTEPAFAIGQRALLVRTPEGNVLWDCVSLLDQDTIEAVRSLGGIDLIAISHPHFYSSMVAWAHAFDARIVLAQADRAWVMRPDGAVTFWSGEAHALPGGLTLIRAGGHFPGGTVLHWPDGAGGRGALLSGDIIMVAPARGWVSFMYSYPNLIPLPATEVRRVAAAVEPFAFDRIYGAWWDRVLPSGGKEAVQRSAARVVDILETGGGRRYR